MGPSSVTLPKSGLENKDRTCPPPTDSRSLPIYYYLDHFSEMLSFVRGTYGSILADEHHAFIARFEELSKDAQYLLIRMINRRGTVFRRHAPVSTIASCLTGSRCRPGPLSGRNVRHP
jgi:hypothetical protein